MPKVRLCADFDPSIELSKCLVGSPCETGRYTGQYDGIPGTFLGDFTGFFIGNFPLWDGDTDAHNSYKDITFFTETMMVDPWMAAKYQIPVIAMSQNKENGGEDTAISGYLSYLIPKTGNRWTLTNGEEVVVSHLALDLEAIGTVLGVQVIQD